MSAVNTKILEWIQLEHPTAVSFVAEPYSTEWAGDTETGFFDSFTLTIIATLDDGSQRYIDTEPAAMERLWRFVLA